MPVDPRISALLRRKYGTNIPDEMLETDDTDLQEARKRYRESATRAGDIGMMQNIASKMGTFRGQAPESAFSPDRIAQMSAPEKLNLQSAKEDYSEKDKVRKYIADKYLTRPEEKVRNPWMTTGKQDEKGNILLYNKETGEFKPGPRIKDDSGVDKKTVRAKEEATSRYKVMQGNLDRLNNLIDQYGTFEMFGPQSEQMDALIYNIALDYAKLVDPESVAREGEVKAAQQYMLPVKGLMITNSSAKQLIQDYKSGLDDRLRSQGINPMDVRSSMTGAKTPSGLSAEEQAEFDALDAEFGETNVRPR